MTDPMTLALLMLCQVLVAAMLAGLVSLALRSVTAGSAPARHGVATVGFYAAALWPLTSLLPAQLTVTFGPDARQLFDASAFSLADVAAASPWREVCWVVVIGALAVTLVRLAMTANSVRAGENIAKAAVPVSPSLYGLPHTARVGMSDAVEGPVLIGVTRPTIVFPPRLANAAVLSALLRHEWAHLLRRDLRAALTQRLVEDLFWWNWPLRLLGRWLSEQREMACDEWAAADPAYPLALARETQRRAEPPPLAAGIGGATIERRLERLAEPRRRSLALHAALVTLAIVAGAIAAPRLDRETVTVIGVMSS